MQNNLSPASVATEARARGDQLGGDRPKDNAPPAATQAQLISAIKAHITKGEKAAEKSEQHYIAAGLHLEQLKDTTASWAEWEQRLKKVGISAGRASELIQVADGRKTAQGLAIASTERSKKHRSSLRNEENEPTTNEAKINALLERAERARLCACFDGVPNQEAMDAIDRALSAWSELADSMSPIEDGRCGWIKDDGGRSKSGVPGADKEVGDCVARAIAIATQRPYREVHDVLVVGQVHHARTDNGPYGRWLRRKGRLSHFDADHGCADKVYGPYLESLGWKFTSTKELPRGKGVHLRADELPPGRLIVHISRHLVAVIDGIIRDTGDCGGAGRVRVQGYWTAPSVSSDWRPTGDDGGGRST